jgi:hypothetical protein
MKYSEFDLRLFGHLHIDFNLVDSLTWVRSYALWEFVGKGERERRRETERD